MAMDFNKPTLMDPYATIYDTIKNNQNQLAVMFEDGTGDNIPTGSVRLNKTTFKFEQWTGAAWAEMSIAISGSAASLKDNTTTGVMTITGLGAATTRVKTLRDANDTILEAGGQYTISGASWTFNNTVLGLGNIELTGTHGAGADIIAAGAGSRMVWNRKLSAFRVGSVNGTQWNAANVGDYSTAMGYNTTASGSVSTALGNGTTASGSNSTALGSVSTASGSISTAMGYNTTASGSVSTALGHTTKAESYLCVAIGNYNVGGGSSGSWVDTDPIFEIGNGAFGSLSNSTTIYKNGNINTIGTVTAAGFSGPLTGNASTATTAGTVTTAAQPAITSVGTLTGLSIAGEATITSAAVSTPLTITNGTKTSVHQFNATYGVLTGNSSADDFCIMTNNAIRMRFTSTGSIGVGLGAGTPERVFEIVDTFRVSATNSVGAGSFFDVNPTGTEIAISASYYSGGSYKPLSFWTGGVERQRIAANGYVGFGDTNPQNTVSIIGASTDGTAGTGNCLRVGTSTNGINFGANNTTNSAWIQSVSGDDLAINPHGGYVGIRTGTADVEYPLQVVGVGSFSKTNSDGAGPVFLIDSTGTTINLVATHYASSYVPLALYAGGAERARVDTSGNIGIGTGATAPTEKLHVTGSIRTTVGLLLDKATEIGFNSYYDAAYKARAAGEGFWIYGNDGNGIDFFTAPSVSADATYTRTRHMRLTTAGRLIIGNATAAAGIVHVHSSAAGATEYSNVALSLRSDTTDKDICLQLSDDVTNSIGFGMRGGRCYLYMNASQSFDVYGNRIRLRTSKTPSSAGDTGNQGEICWDADFIYVCTATNTWKRVAIATW